MLDQITFSTYGWQLQLQEPALRAWDNDLGDELGLYYFDLPPDIPHRLSDPQGLRRAYWQLFTGVKSDLVELKVLEIDGLPAVRFILKVPQNPSGMTYVGSITLPRREFSFVIKFRCEEYGTTGLREALVLDRELATQRVYIDKDELQGWVSPSGESSFSSDFFGNRAEVEEHDADFPEHPLSRVRRYLNNLESTVRLADNIKHAAAFEGLMKTRKPWWKLWG